jgi:hypothetical protein
MPSFKKAMRIDRTNYEIFFLDYFEGNLAGAQVEELLAFLEAEPDLKAEFDTFEMVSLPGMEEVTFEGKASLKRGEVTPDNYEWYFAAYAEGDLDAVDRSAVEAFAARSPKMQREFKLMQQVRLQPDQNHSISRKGRLETSQGHSLVFANDALCRSGCRAVVHGDPVLYTRPAI